MLKHRVIATLLWDQFGLCKPKQFKRPGRRVGSLMPAIRIYENRNIDELIILDIDATPQGRGPRFEEIKEFTSQTYSPLTVGGGITALSDIEGLLRAGADKVAINTAAAPKLISDAAKRFGSQAIVAVVDCIDLDTAVHDTKTAVRRAVSLTDSGAGEILLTSVDHDGMMGGYDTDLITAVTQSVFVPVIANGGAGKPEDMFEAFVAGASACSSSSMFLFSKYTPNDCKKYLDEMGIPVRLEETCPES